MAEDVITIEEKSNPETIVILGCPGSGKDTQANYLVGALGYKIISTGDLARILAGHNETVRNLIKKGELIPDSLIEDEMLSAFVLLPEGQPVILDGYPRNLDQAKKLDEILAQNGRKLDKVILIKISDQEAVKRLGSRKYCTSCGHPTYAHETVCPDCGGKLEVRTDDTKDAIKHRLEVYHAKTEPMVEYFKSLNILREVDGTPAPEKVREEIREVL